MSTCCVVPALDRFSNLNTILKISEISCPLVVKLNTHHTRTTVPFHMLGGRGCPPLRFSLVTTAGVRLTKTIGDLPMYIAGLHQRHATRNSKYLSTRDGIEPMTSHAHERSVQPAFARCLPCKREQI